MRPDRFERLLADAINNDGRLTARTYTDAGFTRSRHGIIATTRAGVPVNIQIVGRFEDSGEPVTGSEHQPTPIPDPAEGGALNLAKLEQYLAGLAVAAAPEETSSVALYQDRDKPGAIRYGVTITYHSGAAIYLYVLSAGTARHADFAPQPTVNA